MVCFTFREQKLKSVKHPITENFAGRITAWSSTKFQFAFKVTSEVLRLPDFITWVERYNIFYIL